MSQSSNKRKKLSSQDVHHNSALTIIICDEKNCECTLQKIGLSTNKPSDAAADVVHIFQLADDGLARLEYSDLPGISSFQDKIYKLSDLLVLAH